MSDRESNIVRRSVALPSKLISDVLSVAPEELKGNLNRLVLVALGEFLARRKAELFAHAMEEMAADPAVRSECALIDEEFATAQFDGLRHD
jgi:hypothetical protein